VVANAESRAARDIGADVVVLDQVRRGTRVNVDSVVFVGRNDVAPGCRGPADGVLGCVGEKNTGVGIAQRRVAGGIEADDVAGDAIEQHAVEFDAVDRVAGDDIAGAGARSARGTANFIGQRSVGDAVATIGQGGVAGDVGADVIAFD